MDLIDAQQKLEQKDQQRNNLLGRKSILVDNLKELGFKTSAEAKKSRTSIAKDVFEMGKHYETGEAKFKNKFGHLLQ